MPAASFLRRPSDLAHELFHFITSKFRERFQRRRRIFQRKCRSTGDLDDTPVLYNATTSGPLPPHFDDCDLVPMNFDNKGAHLLKQSKRSHRMLERTFMAYSHESRLYLALVHRGKALHLPIILSQHLGYITFRIDLSHTFRSLVELVEYFSHHKGYILPCYLSNPV